MRRHVDDGLVPLAAGFLAVSALVYGAFLFGDRLLLFPRVGSDTCYQYWPFDRYLGELLRGAGFSGWTFRIGLGQQIFAWASTLNPFALLLRLLPPQLQAGGYAWKMVLECACAAWLWRRYLRSLGIGGLGAAVVPLLYGFNGYLTLWGQHSMFGVVFSLVPLTLLAHEHLLRRGRWWPLALSLGAFLATSFYFFVMFAVFFALFAPARAAAVLGSEGRALRRAAAGVARGGLAALALAAWSVLPMLAYLRTSPRAGQAPVGLLAAFPLADYAGLLRVYSNNVFGTDVWFRGPMNYYELPQLACGMLPLLLAPQFFRIATGGERRWTGAALGVVAVSLVSPFAAQVFVGFTAPTFRHSFLWIVLCLYLAARVLHAMEGGARLDRRLLGLTAAALALPAAALVVAAAGLRAGLVEVPAALAERGLAMMRALRPEATPADFAFALREELAPVLVRELGTALVAIGVYAGLLLAFPRRPRSAGRALLAAAVVELALLTWPTANRRVTLAKTDLLGGAGYFDATGRALQAVRAADGSWFRVDKTYRSVFLNDPLFQGYFGTWGYTSVNEPATLAFLEALGVPTFEGRGPNYVAGFGDRDLLNALVGVKYLLAKEPVERPGYRRVGSAGGVLVYRNERALPLGFVQRRVLEPGAFAALAPQRRDLALLEGFVPGESLLRDPALLGAHSRGRVPLEGGGPEGVERERAADEAIAALRREPFEILAFREDRIRGRVAAREPGVLVTSIPFNRGWRARVDGRPVPAHRVDFGFTGIPVPAGSHEIDMGFVPEGGRLGLAVSLFAALGVSATAVAGRRPGARPADKPFRGC